MEAQARNRLRIDVDNLAKRPKSRRRNRRDLTETIYYEINNKKVPVFTAEFLEENRIIDGELRKLRKLNNDYEEHNSVLVKYIDSLNTACDQICEEYNELVELKEALSTQLNLLKASVAEKYGITIPKEEQLTANGP